MHKPDGSDRSDMSDESGKPRIILPHGGYRKLRSFHAAQLVYDSTVLFCERFVEKRSRTHDQMIQAAQLVYDSTVLFCERFVEKRSRTHDQMIQAARSGVQNIAEGSMASATSARSELKLTGVARASLEELLLDYEDFLRQRGLRLWPKDSPEALAVRGRYRSDGSDASDRSDPYGIRTASPEVAANTLICLVNQASYLLGRQLQRLEQEFLEKGGVTERMYAARREHLQRRY